VKSCRRQPIHLGASWVGGISRLFCVIRILTPFHNTNQTTRQCKRFGDWWCRLHWNTYHRVPSQCGTPKNLCCDPFKTPKLSSRNRISLTKNTSKCNQGYDITVVDNLVNSNSESLRYIDFSVLPIRKKMTLFFVPPILSTLFTRRVVEITGCDPARVRFYKTGSCV